MKCNEAESERKRDVHLGRQGRQRRDKMSDSDKAVRSNNQPEKR